MIIEIGGEVQDVIDYSKLINAEKNKGKMYAEAMKNNLHNTTSLFYITNEFPRIKSDLTILRD